MESRIAMLGAALETRGAIAAVAAAYRAAGLFERWPVHYIETHGDVPPLERLALWRKAARALAREIAQHRGLVVHLHSTPRRLWKDSVFLCAALLARAPVILHLHGGGFDGLYEHAGTPGRTFMPMLLARASVVAANSEALRGWVLKLARGANAVLLPDPVATPPRRAPGAVVPGLVVFLGRLEPASGIFDLLDALAPLRSHVPALRLMCAGGGNRGAVERHAERLGIADVVKFTGWVGPSGKRALLESAAAFALPSYEEGLPMSLLEAMGAGVPVVASRASGAEVVADGVSGFLVAPGDKATLGRALRNLLLDAELAARIGAAARESVRGRFAPERSLAMLEDLYRRLGLAGEVLDLKKAA